MSAGKFRSALTALASLSVTGVLHNYDIDAVPEKISRAALPALIVAPALDDQQRHKFSDFEMASPSGSSGLAHYIVTHLLLFAPVGNGRGAKSNLPGLVDIIDNYANAIRANPRLGSTLYQPTLYTVHVAPVWYGGGLYYGCRFWHTM